MTYNTYKVQVNVLGLGRGSGVMKEYVFQAPTEATVEAMARVKANREISMNGGIDINWVREIEEKTSSSPSSSSSDDIGAIFSLIGWTFVTTWAVTKWVAPKVWKGCELAVEGVEWTLSNVR